MPHVVLSLLHILAHPILRAAVRGSCCICRLETESWRCHVPGPRSHSLGWGEPGFASEFWDRLQLPVLHTPQGPGCHHLLVAGVHQQAGGQLSKPCPLSCLCGQCNGGKTNKVQQQQDRCKCQVFRWDLPFLVLPLTPFFHLLPPISCPSWASRGVSVRDPAP